VQGRQKTGKGVTAKTKDEEGELKREGPKTVKRRERRGQRQRREEPQKTAKIINMADRIDVKHRQGT
jgi:hypothetical protein